MKIMVYDMLIVKAAQKAKVNRILTLNESDFSKLCQKQPITVSAP